MVAILRTRYEHQQALSHFAVHTPVRPRRSPLLTALHPGGRQHARQPVWQEGRHVMLVRPHLIGATLKRDRLAHIWSSSRSCVNTSLSAPVRRIASIWLL